MGWFECVELEAAVDWSFTGFSEVLLELGRASIGRLVLEQEASKKTASSKGGVDTEKFLHTALANAPL